MSEEYMSSQLIGLKIKRFFDEVVTLTKSRGRWFEPSRGSQKKALAKASAFFNEICPSGKWNSYAVKYLLRKCEMFAARTWANFISHCDQREQYFTIHEVNYFTFGNAEYFTKFKSCNFILWPHNGATILHPNTKVLVNQGLFVFLGVKTFSFHHCTFSPTFWIWTYDLITSFRQAFSIIYVKKELK